MYICSKILHGTEVSEMGAVVLLEVFVAFLEYAGYVRSEPISWESSRVERSLIDRNLRCCPRSFSVLCWGCCPV